MTSVSTDTFPTRRFPLPEGLRAAVQGIRAFCGTPAFWTVCAIVLAVAVWGAAIAVFGYPAIILPALALVPTMFTVLLLITVGK